MTIDSSLEKYREWVGRSEQRHDVVTAAPLVALSALLDRADPTPRAASSCRRCRCHDAWGPAAAPSAGARWGSVLA